MLSDESCADEDLDKSSPVRPSDRVLRSSSHSKNADRITVKKLNSNMTSSNDFDKTITSNLKQTSRSSKKIRLSIERSDIFYNNNTEYVCFVVLQNMKVSRVRVRFSM
jgi:hypothetical protein